MDDREAGAGSPLVLVQVAVVTLVAAGMLRQAARARLPQSAAPGRIEIPWDGQGRLGQTTLGE